MMIPDDVFEIGILDREYHARLLADLPKWTTIAGIPPEFVWAKLSKYCTDLDVNWVHRLKKGNDHGLVYTGKFDIAIEDKMAAITGACLRNYIDARLMTVQQVVARLKKDQMPDASVILVPNFCMSRDDTYNVAPWEASALLGWLYSRLSKNLKTVLYVSDMKMLAESYGDSMVKHLKAHYMVI